VTFDLNGGTRTGGGALIQTVAVGGSASSPSFNSPAGKYFVGWSRSLSNITSDVTITAHYAPYSYTVTFDIGDGTRTGGGELVQTISYGGSATAPIVSAPPGYNFSTWNKSLNAITSSRTITAQYSIKTYTVTFDLNGGTRTGGGALTQTVSYGGSATYPTFSNPTGKYLRGWSGSASNVTSNVTVTAIYSPYTYTVTFDIGDGTRTGGGELVQTINYGGSATAPIISAPPGYNFSTWDKSLNAITSSRTITAQYTLKTYTVTFNTGGGSSVSSQSVTHGNTVVPPADPTKTGYTFTGWYPSLDTIVTSSGTFNAQWSANSYTVFFNSNGGSYVPTQAVHHDQYADVPTTPTKAGHHFNCWDPPVETTKITSSRTFSALWTPNLYEAKFISEDAVFATQRIEYDNYASEPSPSPTRTGYVFAGWSPIRSSTKITANTIFYAQWTPQAFTVSFDTDGGSSIADQEVNYGEKPIAPAEPTKEYWMFENWYINNHLVEVENGYLDRNIYQDTTFTAEWATNDYVVTFYSMGAEFDRQLVRNGQFADVPEEEPTREGYTFAGWSPNVAETRITASHMSFNALWDEISEPEPPIPPAPPEPTEPDDNPATLTSIAITNPPSKTEYAAGESFNRDEMEVTAYYSDNTSLEIFDYSVEPEHNLPQGTYDVTITYNDETATQEIVVGPAALSSIAVTTSPDKTVYLVGEMFDADGMEVTAKLTDGSTQPVTNYSLVPSTLTPLAVSNEGITISYTLNGVQKTVNLPIYVLADVELRPSRRTHKELPFECSSGVGSVNTYAGRFCFNHKDVTVGAGSFILGVAHNYNSHWLNDSRIRADLRNTYMGRNWKLDIQQYVFEGLGKLIYVDAAGNCNDFMLVGDNVYLDALGSGSKIEYFANNSDRYVLSDVAGNELRFNSDGRLTKIVSGTNSDICKRIVYRTDGKLDYMCDYRKLSREIVFEYNNSGLLDAIITKEGDDEKHRISCHYNAGKLTELSETLQNVTGSSSQVSRVLTKFVYDSNNNLSVVYNAQNKTGLKIETDAGTLWTTDIAIGVAGAVGNEFNGFAHKASVEIQNVTQYLTSVESDKSVTMCYELNDDGDCVSIYERYNDTMMSSVMPSPEGKRFFAKSSVGYIANSIRSYEIDQSSAHPTYGYFECGYDANGLTATEIASIISANTGKHVVLSAWVYVDSHSLPAADKPLLTLAATNDSETLRYHIPINKEKVGQWQYVSQIVKLGALNEDYSCKLGITKYNDTNSFTFYVSDFRIVPLRGETKVYDVNLLDLTIAVASRSGQYSTATRNLNQLQPSDSVWFVTQADIEHTLRDKYLKSSQSDKRFTFYHNNLTHAIPYVETLTLFNVDDNVVISTTSDNANVDDPILCSETTIGGTVVKKHRVYHLTDDNEKVYTDFVKYGSVTDSKTYFMDGRIKETVDEYDVKTGYSYDSRGNLIQKVVSNNVDSAKIQQSFVYDYGDSGIRNDQLTSFTDEFGVAHTVTPRESSQPFSLTGTTTNEATGVTTTYGYDSWLRNTGITDNNGTELLTTDDVANTFTYNTKNQLHTVSDGVDTYELGYNNFGDFVSMKRNGNVNPMFGRVYDYGETGNSVTTTYANGSNSLIQHLDKYGRQSLVEYGSFESSWVYKDINSSGTNVVNTSGARLDSIIDGFCGRTKTFHYNDNGSITRYDVSGNVQYSLEGMNPEGITSNIKRYKFVFGEDENINQISYDYQKLINPRIVSALDASAETVTYYSYDNLGRIKAKAYTNDPDLYGWTFREEYEYREYTLPNKGTFTSNIISSITEDSISGPTIVYDLSYTNGRLSGISRSSTSASVTNGTVAAFSYNARGQVTSETTSAGSLISYQYDNRGNLTQKASGGSSVVLGYEDNSNRLSTLTLGSNTRYISYDACGNPTKYKVASATANDNMSWTRGNLLNWYANSSNTYLYFYDVNGVRVGKGRPVSSGTFMDAKYIVDGSKILAEVRSGVGTINYGYDMSGVSAIKCNDEMYQLKRDVLGNVTEIHHRLSTSFYEKVATYTYDAFGNCIIRNVNGTVIEPDDDHIANINPFRWKGYYWDAESGLYYVNGRYYDPETGRFINPDYASLDPSHVGGGQNPYILPGNHVAFARECSLIFTSIPLAFIEENYDDSLLNWILGGIIIVGSWILTAATGGATLPVAIGATVGGALGVVTGGTNGFTGGWNEDRAASGFMTGSLIGVAAGAGYMVNAGAGLASLGYKLAGDTVVSFVSEKPIPLFDHFRWEEYALAFAFGGLTNGLSPDLKNGVNAFLQPVATQLAYMGTRGTSWSTEGYINDVAFEIITDALLELFKGSPLRNSNNLMR
jgi:RHS repeat-associated protein/uncharacterized repeat protein (TIGR02543 family)